MTESTAAERIDAELRIEANEDPLIALVESMPPAMHNKACAAKYFGNSWWAQMEVREGAGWVAGGAQYKSESLCSMVEGIAARGHNRPDWGSVILNACRHFDVEMVRVLLAAGVRADQLYTDAEGYLWDLATCAMQSYQGRAQSFEDAPALWADKCAEIVALTVAAGGPQWLGVWLGPEFAPVLASRHLRGVKLQGWESWQELQYELGAEDGDLEDAVAALLDQPGVLVFGEYPGSNAPAAARFTQRVFDWFDWVESWGGTVVEGSGGCAL